MNKLKWNNNKVDLHEGHKTDWQVTYVKTVYKKNLVYKINPSLVKCAGT